MKIISVIEYLNKMDHMGHVAVGREARMLNRRRWYKAMCIYRKEYAQQLKDSEISK